MLDEKIMFVVVWILVYKCTYIGVQKSGTYTNERAVYCQEKITLSDRLKLPSPAP